jgi:mRNA-degrading endonuclease RelE of RelBE toxin-antitoxin system
MPWTVEYSRKAAKQLKALPDKVQSMMTALRRDMEISGPNRGNWPNFSKLGGNRFHCHLNKKGRPTWVVVWEVIDKNVRIIEVSYVGTRENAPY